MEQKTVRRLEQELEEAISQAIVRMGLKKLPLLPSRQTTHLMTEAAVAVYESAVENQHGPTADGYPPIPPPGSPFAAFNHITDIRQIS